MGVCPVGAVLIHENGRTDIMKLFASTETQINGDRRRQIRVKIKSTSCGLKCNKIGNKKGDAKYHNEARSRNRGCSGKAIILHITSLCL